MLYAHGYLLKSSNAITGALQDAPYSHSVCVSEA